MPSKLEIDLENECVAFAQAFGWMSAKFNVRGWPDRLFLGPGRRCWLVEFKRPGEKPRPQQLALHRRLAVQSHPVSVIETFAQFEADFDALVSSILD